MDLCWNEFQPCQAATIVDESTSSVASESPETLLITNLVRGIASFSNSFEKKSLWALDVILLKYITSKYSDKIAG